MALAEQVDETKEHGMGWDWHENQKEQMEKLRREKAESVEETKLAFEACFNSPSGAVVLDYLKDWALKTEGFDPALGFYNGAANGFYREGQNRLIAFIHQMAKPAKRQEQEG